MTTLTVSKKSKKTSAQNDQIIYDYQPLIHDGVTLLKFGESGSPHEKIFKLSKNLRYLYWRAGWFCSKHHKKCQVDLEKVTRIMPGQNTFQFQRYSSVYGEASHKSFTILYLNRNNAERSLNLVAETVELYQFVFGGLSALVKKLKDAREHYSLDALYLKSLWDRADTDQSGSLSVREVLNLVSSINVNMPTVKVREIYKTVDVDNSGTLDFAEFNQFMLKLRKRTDLEAIWASVVDQVPLPRPSDPLPIDALGSARVDDCISFDQFIVFWREYQGQDLTPVEARELLLFCNAKQYDQKPKSPKALSPKSSPKSPHNTSLFNFSVGSLSPKRSPQEHHSILNMSTHNMSTHSISSLQAEEPECSDADLKITYSIFCKVMTNPLKMSLFDMSKASVYQDMTKPLSFYYMASSHNTYLEGDQLTSFSSVNRYVNDLLSGCRCVELDCWDGDNGVPMICHGHTITGKIMFKDVIKAIAEYGFKNSPYPIVLSVENHCSLEQQRTLALILKRELKHLLLVPQIAEDGSVVVPAVLPSPEELRHKVLIKGKRANDVALDDEEEEEEEDEDAPKVYGDDGQIVVKPKEQKATPKRMPNASKIHLELSALIYLGTGKVKVFNNTTRKIPCNMMCSYSEGTTNRTVKYEGKLAGWIEHNKEHLSRIYPRGTRIDSSNYMPTAAWAAGNQLVALNYQTGDLPYHVNYGKFIENGRCGYVLKPEFMICPVGEPVPPQTPAVRLVINMIAGNNLPKPGGAQKGEVIDPFVAIHVNGPSAAENAEARTRTVLDNGLNPVWNQTFTFEIARPDLTYLTFHVLDEDVVGYDFVAFASLPVSCVRSGFHTLRLLNVHGRAEQDFEFSSLFMRVSVEPLETKSQASMRLGAAVTAITAMKAFSNSLKASSSQSSVPVIALPSAVDCVGQPADALGDDSQADATAADATAADAAIDVGVGSVAKLETGDAVASEGAAAAEVKSDSTDIADEAGASTTTAVDDA